ncbi:MAG: hypothetical protein ACK55Z_28170, partial [bacterium]
MRCECPELVAETTQIPKTLNHCEYSAHRKAQMRKTQTRSPAIQLRALFCVPHSPISLPHLRFTTCRRRSTRSHRCRSRPFCMPGPR